MEEYLEHAEQIKAKDVEVSIHSAIEQLTKSSNSIFNTHLLWKLDSIGKAQSQGSLAFNTYCRHCFNIEMVFSN